MRCFKLAQSEPIPTASDGLPARATGPWVLDKRHYFERYLDIFSRGVGKKWAGKLSYVDLFSGPGRSIIRGTGEEVEGSPLLSLKHEFAGYVFVDIPEVLSALDQRLKRHRALPSDHLTLAFIDPTGLQIQFRTIERLVHNRKVDLLMTIQFGMGIRMNLPLSIQSEGAALTGFMGNTSWRQDVEEGGSISRFARRVLNRYMKRLRVLDYGTVQDREIEIRTNESNLLLYFMVLASRHKLGAEFWRKATQIGPSGQRMLNLPTGE